LVATYVACLRKKTKKKDNVETFWATARVLTVAAAASYAKVHPNAQAMIWLANNGNNTAILTFKVPSCPTMTRPCKKLYLIGDTTMCAFSLLIIPTRIMMMIRQGCARFRLRLQGCLGSSA